MSRPTIAYPSYNYACIQEKFLLYKQFFTIKVAMGRGNPKPKIENIKQYQYPRIDEKERDTKPVHVRIPESQYDVWMMLPSDVRNGDLREAIANIIEKRKDLLLQQ
ncbi:MAG: hypothetical protein ACRC2V_07500 [Xenococcaceae cyanobacterium]